MKSYAITSEKYEGQVLIKYCSNGTLKVIDIREAELNENQCKFFFRNVPFLESEVLLLPKIYPFLKVVEVPDDLSFIRFYNDFANKVGKKKRAEQLWNALNEADRSACLKSLAKYRAYIAAKGINMVYPETYLSQRRWENEYN